MDALRKQQREVKLSHRVQGERAKEWRARRANANDVIKGNIFRRYKRWMKVHISYKHNNICSDLDLLKGPKGGRGRQNHLHDNSFAITLKKNEKKSKGMTQLEEKLHG